jgi:PIN domain nuclease of toxin-antitoxin system
MRPTVQQWIRDALRATRVVPISLDAEMATDGAVLHAMHPDPFDRLIVATAVHSRARLATADTKIIAFARAAGVKLLEL